MEKVVQKFRSYRQSAEADCAYYRSLTLQQRLDIVLDLIAQGQGDEAKQRFARVYRITKLHGP